MRSDGVVDGMGFGYLAPIKKREQIKPTTKARSVLLQNCTAGYIGNSPVFWQVGGSGYTQWIADAKVFTEDEADAIIKSTNGTHNWKKWPLDDVRRCAKATVDIQDLRKQSK